ncbi:MAG: TlpA family protein disulfide reductase [Tomitella sp.]|nr:TlpA family protein disulfide reductase [Tomitella sp.]
MRTSTKVSIGVLIVLIAIMVALWPRGDDTGSTPAADGNAAPQGPAAEAVSSADRAAAALDSCPAPSGPARQDGQDSAPAGAAAPMNAITLDCLADGAPVDLGRALAGKPAVINLWAYWCAPCRDELPALEEFADRAGDQLTVLTAHSDSHADKALALLEDLGVHLPGVEDPDSKIATAVGAPQVLPVTILLRPDGTVAQVVTMPFANADQIADVVAEKLGVSV